VNVKDVWLIFSLTQKADPHKIQFLTVLFLLLTYKNLISWLSLYF